MLGYTAETKAYDETELNFILKCPLCVNVKSQNVHVITM